MKRIIFAIAALLLSVSMMAQDKTLRIDYIFSGTDKTQEIALDEMSSFDGWAGRRVNMDEVPVTGNGQIVMTAKEAVKSFIVRAFQLFSRSGRQQRKRLASVSHSRMYSFFRCLQ